MYITGYSDKLSTKSKKWTLQAQGHVIVSQLYSHDMIDTTVNIL